MTDVLKSEPSQRNCLESRNLPDTPSQATDVPKFDIDDISSVLDEAHGLIWEDEDASDLSMKLELTFRAYNPSSDVHDVAYCHRTQGQWMRYRCDLTQLEVAAREGSPIPVIAVHDTSNADRKSVVRCYKIHPDLLDNRDHLLEMLASTLERRVIDGIYQAREALSCFRHMSGRSSLPGVQTGSISYPQGYGFKALGDRPTSEA